MTLTEQWKKGELNALDKLIKQIEVINNYRALSDEYLKSNGQCTREDYNIVGEWGYGIVWVIVDYVLPYLKQMQQLKEDNRIFEEKIHNSYLEIGQLKELLRECREASLDYGNHSGNYELYDRIDNAIGEK